MACIAAPCFPYRALMKTRKWSAPTKSMCSTIEASLRRPPSIVDADLMDLSFYAFYRQFYYHRGSLHRRRNEKFVSVSGTGFPAQAARSHADHDFYAQRVLYAYMPCSGLTGFEYIDAVVVRDFEGSYRDALRCFVRDECNLWCPTWIRRNYEFLNEGDADTQKRRRRHRCTLSRCRLRP